MWSKNSENTQFDQDPAAKHSWYVNSMSTDVETAVKQDIYEFGAVTVGYDVYNDFMAYVDGECLPTDSDRPENGDAGVYQYDGESDYLGGHAVKVIGWGTTEGGCNYWLVVNSWGPDWGEGGLFRIKRGINEVGIESYVVSGRANVTGT